MVNCRQSLSVSVASGHCSYFDEMLGGGLSFVHLYDVLESNSDP